MQPVRPVCRAGQPKQQSADREQARVVRYADDLQLPERCGKHNLFVLGH